MNTQRGTATVIDFPGRWADISMHIAQVTERYPELSSYGWHFVSTQQFNEGETFEKYRADMCTEYFARQVAACLEVMSTPQPRGYALRVHRRSSYGLKHRVERRIQQFQQSDLSSYISNGALIVAAVIEGWEPVRWANDPNCAFRRRART